MMSFLTSGLKSFHLFHRKWFFVTFYFLTESELKFGTGTQNWMLIHIAGSKSGFMYDFRQYHAKTIILRPFWGFFGQTPLRNSIAMATPKISGDQKLFERVCYMLKLKSQSFTFPDLMP